VNDDQFIWDEENIEHIGVHNVTTDEAEEAMLDGNRVKFPAHSGSFGFIGSTEEGRRLVVIFVKRYESKYRVITARDATATEKKIYNKRRREQ
jgi:uncharacterized DUF497 family protein